MHLIPPRRVTPEMRFPFLAAAWLLTTSAFDPPHKNLAASEPVFRAEEFFLGRTEGKGTIKQAFARRSAMVVQSVGRVDPDGTLVLEQRVRRGENPPDQRQWRIKKLADGRYAGTISDAKGPVTGEVRGNCLHLTYTMTRGGMRTDQYIYLQPGGRVALNRMTIKKLGLTFATVEETIRKIE